MKHALVLSPLTRRWGTLVTLLVTVLAATSRADIIEQILVKVNGEIFTKTDLEARQVSALRQMGQQFDRNSDPSDAQLRGMLEQVTPDLIVNAVDEILIVQRGRDLGYRLSDDDFNRYLDNIKKDNKLEDDEQFKAALKGEGMTLDDLRRNIERQMIVQRVQQNEVQGKIAVSDDEARRYYDAHQSEFTTPQTITLREIFVAVPSDGVNINVGADEAGRGKAAKIRERALAGESYERLAADLSDSASRANAGLIGPLNVSDLAPELQKMIQAMKVGDVSGLIRTPKGYQILKLESSTPVEIAPFDQAKEQISERVYVQKRQAEFDKFLVRLRSEAIIEWKNADIQKAYDQGVAKQKAAAASSTPSSP
jgi:peptidyl-prolyl cis-trans isomerase SurA